MQVNNIIYGPSAYYTTNAITLACVGAYFLADQKLKETYCLNPTKVMEGEAWRLITYPFLHGNLLHLAMNVSSLRHLGPHIQNIWGTSGFVKIAALSIAADLGAKVMFQPTATSIGLSGVLCGMLGSMHVVHRPLLNPIFNKQAIYKTIALTVAVGIILKTIFDMRMDHLAHLSGYVAGLTFSYMSGGAIYRIIITHI